MDSKVIKRNISHVRQDYVEEQIYLDLVNKLLDEIENLNGKDDLTFEFGKYNFQTKSWEEYEFARFYIIKFEKVYEIQMGYNNGQYHLYPKHYIINLEVSNYNTYVNPKWVKAL